MSNPFSTESLLAGQGIYAVVKGDVAGHPFHGNQYTGGSQSALNRATKVAGDRIAGKPNRADALAMAEYHRGEATKATLARNATGYKDVAANLNSLAKAHLAAAKTWSKVADYGNKNVEADASKAVSQTHAALIHYGNSDLPK